MDDDVAGFLSNRDAAERPVNPTDTDATGVSGDGSSGEGLSRRRFVGLAGLGTVGALAGCSADGTVSISGEELKHSRTVLGRAFPHVPENVDLNPWGYGYRSGLPSLLFAYPLTIRPDGSRTVTDLIADVTVAESSATVTYSDAFSWWNGEPVTARDRYVAVRINDRIGVRTGIETIDLLDEYTVRYEFPSPLRRSLALERALGYVHNTPAWYYEEWLERLEDATTGAELETERAALRSDAIPLSAAADRGIGCGPYRLVEISPNRLVLEVFEDHPHAGDIDVPRLWFPITEGTRSEAMTETGVLDLGQGLLRRLDRSPSSFENVEQLEEHATRFGVDLLCHYGGTHLGRRNVRRAIAAVLPLPTLVESGAFGASTSLQTGLATPVRRRFLSPSFRDSLHRYPVERDEARAATFMRRAGYERRGEEWIGPGGNAAEIYLELPAWGRWASVAETIEGTLDHFGIVVDLETYPRPAFLGKAGAGNFDLSVWRTTGTPLSAYDVTSARLGGLGSGVTDAERTTDDRGRPMEPTIPTDPGALEVTGEGRTVDLLERYRELRRPATEERTRELIELFARWWNYELPNVQLATTLTGIWGNTNHFEWPAAGDDVYRTAGPEHRIDYHLLRTGAVSSGT